MRQEGKGVSVTRSVKLAGVSVNLNVIVVASVTIALTAAVVVLALLNREYIAPKKEAQDAGVFFLHAGDKEYTVTMDDIEALSPFDIDANYKKSGQAPETKTYRGVSLKATVESLGIDPSAFQSVSFAAVDGYTSALTIDEAMDDGNCYIVVSMDGKPLGTKEDGGSGPFMMILAHDQFSQRWCKFLLEIKLQ